MDVIHIILGRSWQFDTKAVHRGNLNQYIVQVGERRIALMSLPPDSTPKPTEVNFLLQNRSEFTETMRQGGGLALILHFQGPMENQVLTEDVIKLLKEFSDITSEDLPPTLPYIRDIEHQIDFIPGSSLHNLPH